MVRMAVSVDDVFEIQTFLFDLISYPLFITCRIYYQCFFCLRAGDQVTEYVHKAYFYLLNIHFPLNSFFNELSLLSRPGGPGYHVSL